MAGYRGVWGNQRSGGVLDAVPEAMVVAGKDGRLLLANAPAERLLGYGRGEIAGQPVEAVVPRGLPYRPDGPVEAVARCVDGSEFPAELSLARAGAGTVVVIRDSTLRRREARS